MILVWFLSETDDEGEDAWRGFFGSEVERLGREKAFEFLSLWSSNGEIANTRGGESNATMNKTRK